MKLTADAGPGIPTLEEAFPTLFSRSTPVIEGGSFLFHAASLLRFHPFEASLMLMNGRGPARTEDKVSFLSGHPLLARIHRTKPEDSYRSLFEPCHSCAVALRPMAPTDDLRALLLAFQTSGFGFAPVTRGEMYATAGLSDVLGLYRSGTLKSNMTAREVASQTIAMEPRATVRTALTLMLERRIRRVFVQGTNAFVSDREVVSHIFSPRSLEDTKRWPGAMLEATLLEVGPVDAVEIDGDMLLDEAAAYVLRSQGGALDCDGGVVSAWDLVIKPFASGRLSIR